MRLCVDITGVFIVIVAVLAKVNGKHLPPYITPCKQNDPNINQCIINEVERLRPYFTKGIPEFSLPPFDPLELPIVVLEHGGGNAVSFKASFMNVKVSGSSGVIINDFKIDLEKLIMEVDLFFPKLNLLSEYEITGKILVLPVTGSGRSSGNFTNTRAKLLIGGKYETKDGQKYLILNEKEKVSLDIGGGSLHFDNLFNGNKQLSDQTNKMINENSVEILKEVTPLIEKTVAKLVYEIVSRVFRLFPVDELLPPQ